MLSTTEDAKEACDILHVTFEGTDTVLEYRLELLSIKFDNLRMNEEETNNDFNGKLCDIANESFSLEEKILEVRLVKKALRSFPPRFAYKATTTKIAKNPRKGKKF